MVSRSSSVILVASALAVGLAAGFSLGRGGPVASAQVGNGGQGGKLTGTDDQALGKTAQILKDDATIYDQLSREYERFQHVNRMFELVAKVVSPTVVHIVTLKSQRGRKFEETGSGVIVRSDKNPGLYVLTNHHVVEGGKSGKIRIFLQDGRR